jgi:hypothetical protein
MAAVLNTVAPESTTVGLASHVPLEPKHEAPAAEEKDAPVIENKKGTTSVPGTFPETPAAEPDKQFSVNPLPAADFAVNPVKLEAGEKAPKSITSNGVHDHVTLDKASYEQSDRIPGLEGLTAPTNLAPTTIGTIIPESSLPIISADVLPIAPVEVLTNSAAPQSSTAALAANVPLERHQAPAVVKESQLKSDEEIGASGMEKLAGEKLDEKAEVENELLSKIPEAPSAAEGTSGKGTDKTENTKSPIDYLAEGASVVGVGLVAAGLAARDAIVHAAQTETAQKAAKQATDAAVSARDTIVASTQSAAQQATDVAYNAKDTIVAGTQSAAQQASETAISAKDTVVSSTQAAAQQTSDATISAKDSAVSGTQSAAQTTTDATLNAKDTVVATTLSAVETTKAAATNVAAQLPASVQNVLPASVQAAIPKPETREEILEKISPEVPAEVKESIVESGQGPEATVNTAAVEQKSAVESELLKEVETAKAFNDKPAKPADNVPSDVKESIVESGEAPEAAANETAVDNKAAVESELLNEIKPVEAIDQQAKPASNVPEEVKESIAEAGRAPEAASSSDAVNHKSAVESELLREVETTKAIDEQPKSKTLPTEPASTSVEAKLLDGAKDSLPSVDDKVDTGFTAAGDSKAAEAGPRIDLPTPPAVVPLVATPGLGPDVRTEVATSFPTDVTSGSETTSPKPTEQSTSRIALPPALNLEAPATPEATTTTEETPAMLETPAKPETPAATEETPVKETPVKSEAPATPAKTEAASTPAKPSSPASSSRVADSPATAERKKKNRLSSFFGKIKEKVGNKDKP